MIPDQVVERVREEADIVSIIGEYVKLKRVGNSYRGPCPFHHGKHDNFSLSPKGGYKCFVCGESGDVFTFVRKHLGLDFVEAVKLVGAKVGIEVEDVAGKSEERDAREPLWEVNASAADFFRTQLWDSPGGSIARDYLASRGLSREDADRFGIGFAPRDASMREALALLGFDYTRQIAAGVLHPAEEQREPRPRFRKRLMFPIYDASGHHVGFGGRALGDFDPKYLNSPDSQVFSKSNLLYGLNWAKQAVRKADRLIVVEGYFDAIRLMLAGINEVVAPMGTALTPQQVELVHKYTKNVFLLYDSDQAGLKATFRSGDELLKSGIAVRVISLPDGDDPDTFVARAGASGFEQAAEASIDVFDRRIQILERTGWFADLSHKRKAIDKLLPTIRNTTDHVLRDLYVSRAAEVAGVPRDTLLRELDAPSRTRRGPAETGGPPREAPMPEGAPAHQMTRRSNHNHRTDRGDRAERELARMLVHRRQFVEPTAERLGPEGFANPMYRAIFIGLTLSDADVPIDEMAIEFDDETTEVLQELMNENGGIDRAEETIAASVNAILARPLVQRLDEINRLSPLATSEEQDGFFNEKRQLKNELRELGVSLWRVVAPSRS